MLARVWCVCLVLGLGGAQEIWHDMNNLSRNLQEEMKDVMELSRVNYSEPVIVANYTASVEFDMRAMGPLYNSTHLVIDAIANKEAYPEGIVVVADGYPEVASLRSHWKPLLAHYAGPAALLAAALLLAVALPLSGLFWCCCYWCRAGRRRRPFDRKYDACLKGLLAIVFIALLTLFLFGVVCLFATDSQVESGAAEAAGSLRTGLADAREYLNATQAHARWLLVDNYQELSKKLDLVLAMSGTMVAFKLGEFSRAVSVTTLNSLVLRLDDVQRDLVTVRNYTLQLQARADTLNAGLRRVRTRLLRTLNNCAKKSDKCKELENKHNIGRLKTEIQYSQMPDVTELLNNVTALLDDNIKEDVSAGQQVFTDIKAGITRSVQEHIPAVKAALAETGARLERVADNITRVAGDADAELRRRGAAADALGAAHARWGPYRRYAGLAAATAPLAVLAALAWGLTCGVCGKRPDVYGASDCCNKGAGSKCLLCGIGLIFLLGGAMSLVLAAYFVVGVGAQRFICDPLTEPRGNRLFADMERFVDLEQAMFNERRDPPAINMTTVLLACHRNRTIYETLQLARLHDVEALRADAARAVKERAAGLRPSMPVAGVTILRRGAKDKLAQLAASGLSDFGFERILDALETNMTSLALDALAQKLDDTARALPPLLVDEGGSLRDSARELRELLADVLTPMLNYTATLNSTALRLRDSLRFNRGSLKEAIDYLMREVSEAELFLNTEGPERLQNVTRQYAAVIAVRLDEYLSRVAAAAQRDVGRCGPLSHAFNATRDAACHKILMPANGYWMAMSWCVLLFVPLLLVAQRLARLYLQADPYPGPLVEAEYLYDASADRDNVPLANAYKAEKRGARRDPEQRAEQRAAPRDAPPPADHALARRYNDMAPKHWEEGPPRYHGPTEYERPPPYYYPGPADRQ